MANTFKNSGIKASAAWQTVYTSPESTTSMVQNMHVCNIHTEDVQVSLRWEDASSGSVLFIARNFLIPSQAAVNILDKGFILEPGDKIQVICSVADGADVTLSYLQIQ